jgi:predicted Zn-dependent protease
VALSRRQVPALVDRSVLFLANAEIADGEIDRAEQMLAERIAAGRPERDITRVYLTHLHADCALQRGQYEAAGERYAEAAALASELGVLVQSAFDLQGLAMALGGQGRAAEALEVDAMAQTLMEELELRETAEWWEALRRRHLDPARNALSGAAFEEARSIGAQCPAGERVPRARELAGLNEPIRDRE